MKSIPLAIRREGFRALFFGHPDATYVFDTSGAFLQCNERLLELTKYTRDEMHAMTFMPIVYPDDRDELHVEPQEAAKPVSQLSRLQYMTLGARTWSLGRRAWKTNVAAAIALANSRVS